MAVNRFILNGISCHGKGAIQEIPGIIAANVSIIPFPPLAGGGMASVKKEENS